MKRTVLALGLALASTAPLAAGTFKHITIDGTFADWAGVPAAYEDVSEPGNWADFKAVYVANDEDFVYVRFTLYAPFDGFTGHNNFYFDTDANAGTGHFAVVGSELLIEGGAGFQQKNGGFNEGGVTGLDWAGAPTGTGTDFEFRVSRHAKFEGDQSPVFTQDTIALALEATDPNWSRADTIPDADGVMYECAPPPPPLAANKLLIPLSGGSWQVNTGATPPDGNWSDPAYDDTAAGWSSGAPFFGFTGSPGLYPVTIATPFATSTRTAYLRRHFTWENATAGTILVASNYLSDGAVFYLNGTELKRVRLPEGPITPVTPATGGPAVKDQAELIGLPSEALIQGDNVLAVELHQSANESADLVFGASLLAAVNYAPVLPDPTQPADRTVLAGEMTAFAVDVIGTPPLAYQWYRNAAPLPDATNATLSLVALAGDAGDYSVHVSNPAGPAVTSRAAKLTVTQTPVVLTDVSQPADQTVAEGATVRLTVAVTGTAPISYQWYKGNDAINGANLPALDLAGVTQPDSGIYWVRVSNPFPSSVDSRHATLTVLKDTTPPALGSAAGGPDQILLAFSETVDATSAGTLANYNVTGGVKVIAAARSDDDPALVRLTTTGQALGTVYTVSVSGVRDAFGNAIGAPVSRRFRSTIQIDGLFADWAVVPLALGDAQESPTAGTDFKDVWITNDTDYVYIRFTLYSEGNPNTWLNNIFIDTDNAPATGFPVRGLGSELLIQQGAGYQEKGGGFNEGGIDGLDWAAVPTGAGMDFECRISRHAKYNSDGLPVFASDTISLLLETEDPNYITTDTVPDTGGITYTFAEFPPLELAPLRLALESGHLRITWEGPGTLESTPSLTAPAWAPIPDAQSGYTVTPTGAQRFYRLTL